MITTLIILNTILAAMTIVFIMKELLINFKESSSKIKNGCILLLTIVTLFLSFTAGKGASFLSQDIDGLKNELLNADKYVVVGVPNRKEDLQNQLANLKKEENYLAIYTVIGYLSFGGLLIINNNIKKELKKRKPEGKWNFKEL